MVSLTGPQPLVLFPKQPCPSLSLSPTRTHKAQLGSKLPQQPQGSHWRPSQSPLISTPRKVFPGLRRDQEGCSSKGEGGLHAPMHLGESPRVEGPTGLVAELHTHVPTVCDAVHGARLSNALWQVTEAEAGAAEGGWGASRGCGRGGPRAQWAGRLTSAIRGFQPPWPSCISLSTSESSRHLTLSPCWKGCPSTLTLRRSSAGLPGG